jgi:hypothetical protein
VLDQHRLVGGRDVVDADRLAEAADHGLGQLVDPALGVDGVLDLLVGDGGGVDADEALVGPQRGRAVSSTAGSKTTSPLSHSTPPSRVVRRARSRLCEVLVTR